MYRHHEHDLQHDDVGVPSTSFMSSGYADPPYEGNVVVGGGHHDEDGGYAGGHHHRPFASSERSDDANGGHHDDEHERPTSSSSSSSASYSVDFDDPAVSDLPRVLLMGPRRSGKTSVQRVVFHKMSPHETLFRLEATRSLERFVVDHTPLCRFTVWDFPGDAPADAREHDAAFARAAALVFVVDAQDEPYDHVLQNFTETVSRAVAVNPHVAVEVFVNKVDGELFLSDEAKYDCRRDIMQQVSDELRDHGLDVNDANVPPISYHLTSIYDHSVFEAFSRVVQKLIPQLPTLENLLNVLTDTCSMEKAYLFDVASKLYVGTDSSPVDMQSVELCSDMIDVVLDVSGIYGLSGGGKTTEVVEAGGSHTAATAVSDGVSGTSNHHHHKNDHDGVVVDGPSYDHDDAHNINDDDDDEGEGELVDSAYDEESASVIRLSNGMVLYLKEVDTMLALVCLTRAENFRKKSLVDYNIRCLKKALKMLVQPPPVPESVSRGLSST